MIQRPAKKHEFSTCSSVDWLWRRVLTDMQESLVFVWSTDTKLQVRKQLVYLHWVELISAIMTSQSTGLYSATLLRAYTPKYFAVQLRILNLVAPVPLEKNEITQLHTAALIHPTTTTNVLCAFISLSLQSPDLPDNQTAIPLVHSLRSMPYNLHGKTSTHEL